MKINDALRFNGKYSHHYRNVNFLITYIFLLFIGNEYSIAIVANDGIHFCKGTCKEESQMWLDILRLFPTATVMGQGRSTGNGGRA